MSVELYCLSCGAVSPSPALAWPTRCQCGGAAWSNVQPTRVTVKVPFDPRVEVIEAPYSSSSSSSSSAVLELVERRELVRLRAIERRVTLLLRGSDGYLAALVRIMHEPDCLPAGAGWENRKALQAVEALRAIVAGELDPLEAGPTVTPPAPASSSSSPEKPR